MYKKVTRIKKERKPILIVVGSVLFLHKKTRDGSLPFFLCIFKKVLDKIKIMIYNCTNIDNTVRKDIQSENRPGD